MTSWQVVITMAMGIAGWHIVIAAWRWIRPVRETLGWNLELERERTRRALHQAVTAVVCYGFLLTGYAFGARDEQRAFAEARDRLAVRQERLTRDSIYVVQLRFALGLIDEAADLSWPACEAPSRGTC